MRVYSAEPTRLTSVWVTVYSFPSGLLVSRCGPGGKTDDLVGSALGTRGIETPCGHTNRILKISTRKGAKVTKKGRSSLQALGGGNIWELSTYL